MKSCRKTIALIIASNTVMLMGEQFHHLNSMRRDQPYGALFLGRALQRALACAISHRS
jgi:hypothetical protein